MARPVAQGFQRAVQQIAQAAQRLAGRYAAGLPLWNALRGEFRNNPVSWISSGYALGKGIRGAVAGLGRADPNARQFLKDIPVVPGLQILDPIDNRIRYRFRARVLEKYGRAPRTYIVDVNSLTPLSMAELQARAERLASILYQTSPNARHGGRVKELRDIEVDLISVGRRY